MLNRSPGPTMGSIDELVALEAAAIRGGISPEQRARWEELVGWISDIPGEGSERRTHCRVPVEEPAQVLRPVKAESITVTSVSCSGARLHVNHKVRVGEVLPISLPLTVFGVPAVVKGQARWTAEAVKGAVVGVQFLALDPDQRHGMLSVVRARLMELAVESDRVLAGASTGCVDRGHTELGHPALGHTEFGQADLRGARLTAADASSTFDPFRLAPCACGCGSALGCPGKEVHTFKARVPTAVGPPPAPVIVPAVDDGSVPYGEGTRSSRRPRLLVIDDEALLLRAIERFLRGTFDVTTASDGVRALAAVERGAFDIILCDVMMPGISGPEVHARIREQHPGQEKRVVFMSGGIYRETERNGMVALSNRLLDKPLHLTKLHEELTQEVGRWGLLPSLQPFSKMPV